MEQKRSQFRIILGLSLLVLSAVIWLFPSDVVELVVRQKEVVLGRYSRGHFGSLFVLTILLWFAAGFSFSKLRGVELFASALMMFVSVFGSLFAVLLVSGMLSMPRYIETSVETAGGEELQGIVRHRPPNEFFELQFRDAPENFRSYPSLAPGYEPVDISLTIDQYGFRNRNVGERYSIVAVGDSFTAGSHVSDEQAWTELLAGKLQTPIYNLGVSGSDPQTYLNNFAIFGSHFEPEIVLFMVYEGNDFRYSPPREFDHETGREKLRLSEKMENWMKASPVTVGLRRFSSEVLEKIGSDNPIPAYETLMGWMPVKAGSVEAMHYYSFKPKRLAYLMRDEDDFRQSGDWLGAEQAFLKMHALSKKQNFRLIMIYVPSKPHVVMPLIADSIEPEQVRTFVAYRLSKKKRDSLPEAEAFKQQLYAQIDSQENVFMQFCQKQGIECISTTRPLQKATAQGVQTYYTYDQHWTPEGNRVVAELLADYLKTQAAEGRVEH
ncbi:MAG: hypothetical protein KDI30_07090 [Pseudomonadales bacterium]|nr:hypothetical protein [Pseudomonadales bacterium]